MTEDSHNEQYSDEDVNRASFSVLIGLIAAIHLLLLLWVLYGAN